MDDDCITELAVHYGKTKDEMEKDVGEVCTSYCIAPDKGESTYFSFFFFTKTYVVVLLRSTSVKCF